MPDMKTPFAFLSLASAAALAFTGCISTHKTVYREQKREKVEFENDSAGRIFLRGTQPTAPGA